MYEETEGKKHAGRSLAKEREIRESAPAATKGRQMRDEAYVREARREGRRYSSAARSSSFPSHRVRFSLYDG